MVYIIETDWLLRMTDPVVKIYWTRDLTQGLNTFITSPVS